MYVLRLSDLLYVELASVIHLTIALLVPSKNVIQSFKMLTARKKEYVRVRVLVVLCLGQHMRNPTFQLGDFADFRPVVFNR